MMRRNLDKNSSTKRPGKAARTRTILTGLKKLVKATKLQFKKTSVIHHQRSKNRKITRNVVFRNIAILF